MTSRFWTGIHTGKRWRGMARGERLDASRFAEIVEFYNRYVERWNEVECDRNKPLELHEDQIGELEIIGSVKTCFTGLSARFALEVYTRRGYHSWAPGLTTRRLPLLQRDIRAVEVQYAPGVDNAVLDEWLVSERHAYGTINRYHSVVEFLKQREYANKEA